MGEIVLSDIKENNEDFEWYPTTQRMIDIIDKDILTYFSRGYGQSEEHAPVDIIDCGAGDGRVLKALSHEGNMYAVEKSKTLINSMDKNIFIIGTDFYQTTLIDKKVNIVFSNPPYSDYINWAEKIIREANAIVIYLIIPERWKNSEIIKDALDARKSELKVLGKHTFEEGERKSRAKVEILSIKIGEEYRRYCNTDPFDIWFKTAFRIDAPKEEVREYEQNKRQKNRLKNKVQELVPSGKGLLDILVKLYNQDLNKLHDNFKTVCNLDFDIMEELNVNVEGVKKALKQRLKGLKNTYWREFFDNYKPITKRLTKISRDKMFSTLNRNMSVDFTEDNAYAITVWAIKNANMYYDLQLIDAFEKMVNKSNIRLYKSNQRTWQNDDWKYSSRPKGLEKYALDYRIILHDVGGIVEEFGSSCLVERSCEFINDLIAVANNLGFACNDVCHRHSSAQIWFSGHKNYFTCDKNDALMEVKAFKNGNVHIKLNQEFIRRLNVEFGRLKGWLNNKKQAAYEINIPEDDVHFGINHRLNLSNVKLICDQREYRKSRQVQNIA